MNSLRFGLFTSSYPTLDIVKSAILAEKQGFSSVWIPDHLTDLTTTGDKVDPWTVLATIGAQTKKVMLSPAVTDTQRVHPARTAHIVATLDELTGGRAALAIGAGEGMNLIPYGIPFESPSDRAQRLREAIEIVKLLWSSTRETRANFRGRFYTLNDAVLDQKPVAKPAPPVYVAALGTSRTLRTTGEVGDGWLPWSNTTETFRSRSGQIVEAARGAGRSPGSIDLANMTHVAITEDADLRKKVIEAMKMEVLVTNHPRVLRRMGFNPQATEEFDYTYQRVVAQGDVARIATEIAKEMPDEIVEQFIVAGGVSEIIEGVDSFRKAGATHIVVRDIVGMSLFVSLKVAEETLRAFGQKVIPYFAEQT
jgi:phthiodiolone/phenolphthiodiolone dimycocerosates ketoreductase